MKAGAIGRLGNETKLLQRQRSQWRVHECVNGEAFILSSEEPARWVVRGITSGKLLKSATSQLLSKKLPRPCRRRVDESVE